MESIDLDEANLAYVEQGTGDPIVFVHGGFSDLRAWASQLRAFSSNYRCIAYSLRYHYPNPWRGDGSDYTVPVHAKDLANLIERLGASPAHLVGTSYGGRIALHLARERPELVRTLVLAEPALSFWIRDTPSGSAVLADLANNYFEPGQSAIGRGDLEQAARLFVDGVGGAGTFDTLPRDVRQRYVDNIRVQAIPASPAPFSRDDATKVRVPVLLINGERTTNIFVLVNDELEKYLPNVERTRIPEASHLMTVTHPNEFNKVVMAFLARYRGKD
ncbi:MAG TPA: alpha/beta hydrolase [bacterium]